MRTYLNIPISLVLLFGSLGGGAVAAPLGTAFTYQGRLSAANAPAEGAYDFIFGLYDAPEGGNPVNTHHTNAAVHVSSGLFLVTLDFGTTAFLGDSRWLEIAVRTNGSGGFTTLKPRQLLAPTPYAISAGNLIGPLPSTQLSGTYPGKVTFNNPANSFAGNGAALTGVNASSLGGLSASNFWQLGGNAGTSAGPHFLGTTDSQPLEIRVGGQRLLRLEANGNIIAGHPSNVIHTNMRYSVVSGGSNNVVQGTAATISGGYNNRIESDAGAATIGGGISQLIQFDADYATIGGGLFNTIQTNADYSTIGGGHNNIIGTNAQNATIPGGYGNMAGGSLSFAGGYGSQAMHDGTFMWSDATAYGLRSWTSNLFVVRASGGTYFYSTSGATVGTYLPAGGMGFSPTSDRNLKENFTEVDRRAVLEKVVRLPVTEWNLVSQPTNIRHIGPMAQDFQAAFGVGEDDRHISTTDADGVALAAIQGLYQMINEKDAKLGELEKEVAELKASLNAILHNSKERLQ